MATTPQWIVLQNSMRIEFAHTHLHTTQNVKCQIDWLNMSTPFQTSASSMTSVDIKPPPLMETLSSQDNRNRHASIFRHPWEDAETDGQIHGRDWELYRQKQSYPLLAPSAPASASRAYTLGAAQESERQSFLKINRKISNVD